jgi:threonyl-tRNA synthetase
MLHRALFGSLERFTGILLEHYAGALPLWLSPVQVVVMTISEGQADYAQGVAEKLRQAGLRVDTDLRGEKINYKIREHSLLKRPYFVVVGDKEKAAGLVAVRARGNQDLGQMFPEALIERLLREKQSRGQAA